MKVDEMTEKGKKKHKGIELERKANKRCKDQRGYCG